MTDPKLTHFDAAGNAAMVDIGAKAPTLRIAVAEGRVVMLPATLAVIRGGTAAKGDVIGTARLAGIMAAKRTHELIPLCHQLALDQMAMDFEFDEAVSAVTVRATCRLTARTGAEMEALTAVSVAALTIYDMCKAIDRGMRIDGIHLVHKSGGKSGSYNAT